MSESAEKADVSAVYPPGGLYAKESITRDEARKLFADYLFDYSDVTENDIYALEALLASSLPSTTKKKTRFKCILPTGRTTLRKSKWAKTSAKQSNQPLSASMAITSKVAKQSRLIRMDSSGLLAGLMIRTSSRFCGLSSYGLSSGLTDKGSDHGEFLR